MVLYKIYIIALFYHPEKDVNSEIVIVLYFPWVLSNSTKDIVKAKKKSLSKYFFPLASYPIIL